MPRCTMRIAGCLIVLAGSALAQSFEDGAAAYQGGDAAAAAEAWRQPAEEGNADAQFNLAVLLDAGDGVAEDRAEAARLYELAAGQGHAGAAFNLGLMHETGEGVAQDMGQAVAWYTQAGEAGDVLAQYKLGLLLSEGGQVPEDPAAAAHWFELAAGQDHAPSMFKLASMYATGRGVEQDLGAANEWNEKADVAQMSGVSATACTQTSLEVIEVLPSHDATPRRLEQRPITLSQSAVRAHAPPGPWPGCPSRAAPSPPPGRARCNVSLQEHRRRAVTIKAPTNAVAPAPSRRHCRSEQWRSNGDGRGPSRLLLRSGRTLLWARRGSLPEILSRWLTADGFLI